ncbi:store-operated calcium entry-associated regulatory factor [Stegostoma tigrinum]|uniref:store-operated calcium entry-associated regulatory factor n=1 Tax=Stegostoma tigrinum TaxID=3053191 RepID=UPI00202AE8C8|nr:store-operated calcium entry-associated regulatory factor [Stegostoma tigrinum]
MSLFHKYRLGVGLGFCWYLCLLPSLLHVNGAQDSERILLREVQALTLYSEKYTTGRRTHPVPQLRCVGGSAGCNVFLPKVVQCYNKGWDGYDVQWECKTDMDKAYQFGAITVSCEGYNYPEDPYILKGSCGLEYVIELTEEGLRRKKSHSGFAYKSNSNENLSDYDDSSSFLVVIGLFCLAYLVYMMCLRSQPNSNESSQNNAQDYDEYCNDAGPSGQPLPPGFKPAFGGHTSSGRSSGPGFWTGIGAGGLLGYLLASRRSQPSPSPYPQYPNYSVHQPQTSEQTGWNPEGRETRTTSGFGGTKRR